MSNPPVVTRSYLERNIERVVRRVVDNEESFVVQAESGKRFLIRPTEDPSWVDMPLELEPDVFSGLAKLAHERNVTFNELILDLFQEVMNKPGELKRLAIAAKKLERKKRK